MKCRICGCTHDRPCPAGCGWATEKGKKGRPICDVCAAFKAELAEYVDMANRVSFASIARLLEEVQAA